MKVFKFSASATQIFLQSVKAEEHMVEIRREIEKETPGGWWLHDEYIMPDEPADEG